MDHVAILLEHVDFLNGLDGLDIELLERGLKLLVVSLERAVDLLCLSTRGAFSTDAD